jgi:hypothetical protein
MPFFNYHHFNICVLFTVLFWPGLFSFCGGFSDFKRRSKLQFHCRHATRPRLTWFFVFVSRSLQNFPNIIKQAAHSLSLSGMGKEKKNQSTQSKFKCSSSLACFWFIYLFIYYLLFFFLFAFRWYSTWNSIEKQSSGTLFPNFRQGQLFFLFCFFIPRRFCCYFLLSDY